MRDFDASLRWILLQHGVLTRRDLEISEELSKRDGISLVEAIVRLGFATIADINNAIADSRVRMIDLTGLSAVLEHHIDASLRWVLVRRGLLTRGDLEISEKLAERDGISLVEAIVRLGFATIADINSAVGHPDRRIVDLATLTVPREVVDLLPESVARECTIMPLSKEQCSLRVAISDPTDFDLMQKLQFILNSDVQPVLALREEIVAAIDRHYGPAA